MSKFWNICFGVGIAFNAIAVGLALKTDLGLGMLIGAGTMLIVLSRKK